MRQGVYQPARDLDRTNPPREQRIVDPPVSDRVKLLYHRPQNRHVICSLQHAYGVCLALAEMGITILDVSVKLERPVIRVHNSPQVSRIGTTHDIDRFVDGEREPIRMAMFQDCLVEWRRDA